MRASTHTILGLGIEMSGKRKSKKQIASDGIVSNIDYIYTVRFPPKL